MHGTTLRHRLMARLADVVIAFRTAKTRSGWRVADLVYEHGGSLAEGLAQPL